MNTVDSKHTPENKERFFIDERVGNIAVRDRHHTKYDSSYPGLHQSTPDVVFYRHGFTANGKWCIHDSDRELAYEYFCLLNNAHSDYEKKYNSQCEKIDSLHSTISDLEERNKKLVEHLMFLRDEIGLGFKENGAVAEHLCKGITDILKQ